jgi:hypothetical protein
MMHFLGFQYTGKTAAHTANISFHTQTLNILIYFEAENLSS